MDFGVRRGAGVLPLAVGASEEQLLIVCDTDEDTVAHSPGIADWMAHTSVVYVHTSASQAYRCH